MLTQILGHSPILFHCFLQNHTHFINPPVVELRAALSKYGLPTDGLKAVLAARLQEHLDEEETRAQGEVAGDKEPSPNNEEEERVQKERLAEEAAAVKSVDIV